MTEYKECIPRRKPWLISLKPNAYQKLKSNRPKTPTKEVEGYTQETE